MPTYPSWLNGIEHAVGSFQRHAREQGSLAGVKMWQATMARYVRSRNHYPTRPAESLLGQLEHIQRTYGTTH